MQNKIQPHIQSFFSEERGRRCSTCTYAE